MASPSELSLDCKPHSYSMLLKSFGDHHNQIHLHENNQTQQQQKLEDFLSRLEDERLKIDAFKRELPLCMQLLTNAVETSRQQLQAYRGNNDNHLQGQQRPVLEEFIPIKQYSNNSVDENQDQKASNNISDKANWMTTAQLWCQTTTTTSNTVNEGSNNNKQQQSTTLTSSTTTTQETDNNNNNNIIGFNIVSPKLNLDTKVRNGGAFLPFSKDRTTSRGGGVTDLALIGCSNETDQLMEDRKKCFEGHDNNGGVVNEQQAGNKAQIITTTEAQATTNITNNNSGNGNSNNGNQTHRKARRCWSPDLHRRFVNALQMLGGSQVATPKQIRELMKVDGLTNDEVKSHLQKYRLHTRRPTCPSPQAISGTPQPHQLVVLGVGGIWVPPEYAAAAAAAAAAHNGGGAGGGPTMTTLYSAAAAASHHPPPHYCAPPVPHDHQFYTTSTNTNSNGNNIALPPLPTHQRSHHHGGQLLHHHHHQQLHVYNSSSQTHSSPESDGRGNGDRSESIEDGKSESSSWKGDSGENGGERKGLAALREDGEESNGSEITLKF